MTVALSRPARRLFALSACFAFGALACTHLSALEITGPTNGTFLISIGEALDFTMGTVGAGSYVSPPAMTGSGLQFLDVTTPGPNTPGGITQVFHFKGIAGGTTVISFVNSNPNGSVSVVDTVYVQ